jgi:Flp pilus assembly protein TadG
VRRTAPRRAANRRQRRRGERGAALVEFAIVVPLFLVLVFGVIAFGLTFNDYISVRQGTREAARQGAVGNFGSTTTCSLTGVSGGPTSDIQKLMCLAKSQIGLSYANTRVKVMSGTADFSSTGTFSKGDSLIVCTEYPVSSVAKFITPVLGSTVLKTKTQMRIETSYSTTETGGQESALTGSDWSWCTVSTSSP